MGTERRVHIEAVTMGIALVVSLIGAIVTFSNLLDSQKLTAFIERLGNPEIIKWVITILAAFMSAAAVGWSLYHKSVARKKMQEKEDEKYQVS